MPPPLLQSMRERAGDEAALLQTMKLFKREIDNLPEKFKRAIEARAYEESLAILRAVDAEGTAQVVLDGFLHP